MYTPILRTRQNELLAYSDLSPAVKSNCFPLFDIAAPSREKDLVSANKYLENSLTRLCKVVGTQSSLFLDSSELDPAYNDSEETTPLCRFAETLQHQGVDVIPVSGLHRSIEHRLSVKTILEKSKNKKICFRLDQTDISTARVTTQALLVQLADDSLETANTYILLDLQSLFGHDPSQLATVAERFLGHISKTMWAGVILVGYGIPDNIAQAVSVRGQGYVPRVELALFRSISRPVMDARFWFGDYGPYSPYSPEIDPRLVAKRMGPKAIYSLEDSWFVVRGGPFASEIEGYDQYYRIARDIVALDEFSTAKFSVGDRYIFDRSQSIPNPGAPGTWIRACVNHHITLTALMQAT